MIQYDEAVISMAQAEGRLICRREILGAVIDFNDFLNNAISDELQSGADDINFENIRGIAVYTIKTIKSTNQIAIKYYTNSGKKVHTHITNLTSTPPIDMRITIATDGVYDNILEVKNQITGKYDKHYPKGF